MSKEPTSALGGADRLGACGRRDIRADRRALHLAAADAARADANALDGAGDERLDRAQVRLPGARRDVVCVADLAAGHRSLAADLALLGHLKTPSSFAGKRGCNRTDSF